MISNDIKPISIGDTISESGTQSTSRALPWIICGLGAIFYCYEYLLRISPSVMTQELMRMYDLTATQIGLFSAYYYHAYVPMQIVVGLAMDRYGPRKLLTLACFSCAIGTVLFASGISLALAEIGRFMVGFGSAFAFVGALKLATIWLPPHRFALVSGIIVCLGMVGAMIGDVFLRICVDSAGWQFTIYSAAVIGFVLTVAIWLVIRDTKVQKVKFHQESLAFSKLFKGLVKAIKNPQIWLNGIVGLLLFLPITAFAELWGIPYLEESHGLGKVAAAHANALIFLGWMVGAPLWGFISDYLRLRRLPLMVSSVLCFIFVLPILYFPGLPLVSLYILLFLLGVASSAQMLVFAVARETSSIKLTATAIALTNFFVMVGGNVFQPVIGKLLDVKWSGAMMDTIRSYSVAEYQFALSVLPLGLFLAFIVTLFLRETNAKIME